MAQQLGRQRSLLEGDQRGVSKRGLAVLNQQAPSAAERLEVVKMGLDDSIARLESPGPPFSSVSRCTSIIASS